MQFQKDILLFDLETNGVNSEVSVPLQIAAVLLDKETLEEKDSFTSYIKQDLSTADPESLKINGIKPEQIENASESNEVMKAFLEKFGTDVLLASWVEFLDRRLLMRAFKQASLTWGYDPHYLDLWPIAYGHLVKNGYTGSIKSQPMFEQFNLPERGAHDALEDCRMEAEVFRKIMKS